MASTMTIPKPSKRELRTNSEAPAIASPSRRVRPISSTRS